MNFDGFSWMVGFIGGFLWCIIVQILAKLAYKYKKLEVKARLEDEKKLREEGKS